MRQKYPARSHLDFNPTLQDKEDEENLNNAFCVYVIDPDATISTSVDYSVMFASMYEKWILDEKESDEFEFPDIDDGELEARDRLHVRFNSLWDQVQRRDVEVMVNSHTLDRDVPCYIRVHPGNDTIDKELLAKMLYNRLTPKQGLFECVMFWFARLGFVIDPLRGIFELIFDEYINFMRFTGYLEHGIPGVGCQGWMVNAYLMFLTKHGVIHPWVSYTRIADYI